MSVVAGLDVGTQSVKLVVYDPAQRRATTVRSGPLALMAGRDGCQEQQASWWIEAIIDCFAQLDTSIRKGIVAVGVSGQQHGFVPLGAAGDVLAPVKLWCDTSSQHECNEIMKAVGGVKRCVELAGNPILVGYTASKVPWTRRHRPEAYRKLAGIALPHDYVNFWLTGERWMECGDASGTGWLDVRTRRWSADMLAATDSTFDLAASLPPLVEADASFPIAVEVADQLGLAHTVRISAGGGDNMMAAIGTGNVVPGMLGMSLGTSGTLFSYADHPVVDESARWAAFCSSDGGWLPLICTMNCTVATGAVARAFGFGAREGDALMAGTSPGAGGLTMLPFFNGERTPDLPHVRGSLHGLDMSNMTRAHMYRAAMEGATYALRNGYDVLRESGLNFQVIRLTGGGARSAVWRQLVADVFELPVEVPAQVESAAFGAALQAWWAHDHACNGQAQLVDVVREHVCTAPQLSAQPTAGNVAAYRQFYQRFQYHLGIAMKNRTNFSEGGGI